MSDIVKKEQAVYDIKLSYIKDRTKICDLDDKIGKRVVVCGWVVNVRRQGKRMCFIEVTDGTRDVLLQCAIFGKLAKSDQCKLITDQTSIVFRGVVNIDDRAKGGYEVSVEDLYIIGASEPITAFNIDSGSYALSKVRHLVLRGDRLTKTMKVRAKVGQAFREFFDKEGLWEVTPPTITQQEVEGGATLFRVLYYEEDKHKLSDDIQNKDDKEEKDEGNTYLTQSSQLYLETMLVSMGSVFCLMPSYRQEKTHTRRHLSEFSHLEAELSFIEFDDLLQFLEKMIKYVVHKILLDIKVRQMIISLKYEQLNDLERAKFKKEDIEEQLLSDLVIVDQSFVRMKHSEAIDYCRKNNIYKDELTKTHFEQGDDIPESPERKMTDMIGKPIFLTHFLLKDKSFYMKPTKESKILFKEGTIKKGMMETESVDLLIPYVGEIVGGSMRIDDYDELLDGFKEHGVPTEKYQWYIDQRKYGSVPHGGFGLGIERFCMWIGRHPGHKDFEQKGVGQDTNTVKDQCLYPRTRKMRVP